MEELFWKIRKFSGWIALTIGAILSLLAGFDLLTKLSESQDYQHIAANTYIVFLSFLVIAAALVRQWITIRKERYASVTQQLHMIFHQIRDLNTYIQVS